MSLLLLRAAVSGIDDVPVGARTLNASDWHLQTGGDSMNWQESTVVNDVAATGEGDDISAGVTGDDNIQRSVGTDTYKFTGTWGKDNIVNVDDKGQIRIGDSANSITINNFDNTKAAGSEGHLGIKLGASLSATCVAEAGQASSNVWGVSQIAIKSVATCAHSKRTRGRFGIRFASTSKIHSCRNVTTNKPMIHGRSHAVKGQSGIAPDCWPWLEDAVLSASSRFLAAVKK